MDFLYILLALFIFGILIFIHELGHFIAARACGVKVLEFAIGMGPKIFSWQGKKSGTRYALRLFPIGGFVNMLGENGMEAVQGENGVTEETEKAPVSLINDVEPEPSEAETFEEPTPAPIDPAISKQAYCNQKAWKRILISIAGPAMNVILGFLLMMILVISSGVPLSTQIGGFHVVYNGENELAEQGLQKGDYLYLIDGKNVSFETLKNAVKNANGAPIPVVIQRLNEVGDDSEFLEKQLILTEKDLTLFQGSLSEGTGLRINDTVIKVNSTSVHTFEELRYEVMNQAYRPVTLTVLRDGEMVELPEIVFPSYEERGVVFGMTDFRLYQERDFGIGTVLKHTWFRSLSTVKTVFDSLFGIASGRYGVETVTGPIGITKTIGEVAQYGILNVLYLVIVITINLGVMNLLPLPALDGGHILIYVIELIRRKPLKKEVEAIINFVGLLLLLSLAVVVAFKDVFTLI